MGGHDSEIQPLQEKIGYRFQDPSLLLRSLTHPSFVRSGDDLVHNQRLEFLGDAVLGMILAEALFRELPDEREGALTRYRSILVNGKQLSVLAEEIGLGDCMRLGEAEEAQGGRQRNSILEDAFEALVAAVYLDGGLEAARQAVLHVYGSLNQRLDLQLETHNPKGRLQELLQPSLGNDSIEYRLIEETGPDHQKEFSVEVWVEGIRRGHGTGNTKKAAEEDAARQALMSFE